MLSERVNVCEEYEHDPSCMHIFIAVSMKCNIIVSGDEFIITDNARRLLHVQKTIKKSNKNTPGGVCYLQLLYFPRSYNLQTCRPGF